jgi:DNA-binding CsgD family transcriptional regulator
MSTTRRPTIALTDERCFPPTLGPSSGEMVGAGRLEKRTVDAVLEAAGATPLKVRQARPAGLTGREVEVLRLIAKGQTNKEIAAALMVTEKTAGHHVEHIYAKTSVSTRVGARIRAKRRRAEGRG